MWWRRHYLECGTGNKVNSCAKCEDNYFLFLNDVLCIPCDHPFYGQNSCGVKCTKQNYEEQRIVLCEEYGCKPGFFYMGGICYPCSIGSSRGIPNCIDCRYLPPEGFLSLDARYFSCLGCESNQYKL